MSSEVDFDSLPASVRIALVEARRSYNPSTPRAATLFFTKQL